MRKILTLLAALVAALMLAGCGDDAYGDDPVDEDTAEDAADTDNGDDDDGDDGNGDGGDVAAELPDEWPDELPVNDRATNFILRTLEDRNGSLYLQAQYTTDEEVEEAIAFLEGLEDDGWTVIESSGVEEDGLEEFALVELEGFGYDVRVDVSRPAGTSRYTHTIQTSE